MRITPCERDSIVHEAGSSQAAAEIQVCQSGIILVTKVPLGYGGCVLCELPASPYTDHIVHTKEESP